MPRLSIRRLFNGCWPHRSVCRWYRWFWNNSSAITELICPLSMIVCTRDRWKRDVSLVERNIFPPITGCSNIHWVNSQLICSSLWNSLFVWLALIAKADCKAVYDHRLVRLCVDLKFNLFGNFLYLLILCCQATYVALYTGIALGSPTPANQGTNYYQMVNYSCYDLCITLVNDPVQPATDKSALRALRLILLVLSGFALLKELFQVLTQREKYFRRFYINLIELHMYVSRDSTAEIIKPLKMYIARSVRSSTPWMSMSVLDRRAFVVQLNGWRVESVYSLCGHPYSWLSWTELSLANMAFCSSRFLWHFSNSLPFTLWSGSDIFSRFTCSARTF